MTSDTTAAVPLYQQVKDRVLHRIASGEWPPGKKIPSENQLVRQLGMSRMTINRAFRELSQEGVLLRVAGVGSFVAEPPHHASLIELRDIAEEVRAEGSEHSARVCRCRREPADEALAHRMEMKPGAEVFHVTLVHRRDELPIQLEDRWVSPLVVPDFLDLDFTVVTPSEHLLRTIRPDEMEHIVQAMIPDASTCQLLAIPPTEPCLRLERRTWNYDRVVTFARLIYPSSRYALEARYALPSGYQRQAPGPKP